mgnify:CR=1 FL=1
MIFNDEFNSPTRDITRVYSIKFLTVFRLQIPRNILSNVMSNLVSLLQNSSSPVITAVLLCLEKLMLMRDKLKNFVLKDIVNNNEMFSKLFSGIISIIERETNPMAMRCVLRIFNIADANCYIPNLNNISNTMNGILGKIIDNSGNGEFNYFYFEAISVISKNLANNQNNGIGLLKSFEMSLSQNFNKIMETAVLDLMGAYIQYYTFFLHLSKDFSGNCNNVLQNVLNIQSWNLNMKYLFGPFIKFLKINFLNNSQILNQPDTPNKIFSICEQLKNFKSYNEMFALLEFFVNFHSESSNYLNMVGNILKSTVDIFNSVKTSNPKSYNELGTLIMMLLAKLSVHMDLDMLMNLVNQVGGFDFLTQISEFFDFINNTNDKKLALHFYLNVMTRYSMNLQSNLKTLLIKASIVIINFYKINFRLLGRSDNRDDIAYVSSANNVILNADVKIAIPKYEEIYKMDETCTFFSAVSALNQNLNTNCLANIIGEMSKRDQDSLKTIASRYNYPL